MVDRVDGDERAAGTMRCAPPSAMPSFASTRDGDLIPGPRRRCFIMQVDGKTIDKATGQPKTLAKAVIMR